MKHTIYPDPIIAQRIQQVFWDNDLIDKEVAQGCRMDRKTVLAYRNGKQQPSISFIRYLCSNYHVSADWILNLNKD